MGLFLGALLLNSAALTSGAKRTQTLGDGKIFFMPSKQKKRGL